jgi:23S rRNA A2030 N6-methylase RlmJ
MFTEFNAHPKTIKTTDCVVRAISTALNKEYMECRRELNQLKRDWNFTSYKDTEFLYKYFEGSPRLIFKAVKGQPRIKGSDFTELHPEGTFVLKMGGHVTVCKDGVILDTWDCSYRSVYTAWEIQQGASI